MVVPGALAMRAKAEVDPGFKHRSFRLTSYPYHLSVARDDPTVDRALPLNTLSHAHA